MHSIICLVAVWQRHHLTGEKKCDYTNCALAAVFRQFGLVLRSRLTYLAPNTTRAMI